MTVENLEQLEALIVVLLAEILEISAENISRDTNTVNELDVDSLQQLELMTRIERSLGVHLEIDDWLGEQTIAVLAAKVWQRRGAV
jgi:acyl carrier protein